MKGEIHEAQFLQNTLKRAKSSAITSATKGDTPVTPRAKRVKVEKAESSESSEESDDSSDEDEDEPEPSFSIAPQKKYKPFAIAPSKQSDVEAVTTFGGTEARITLSTRLRSVVTQELTPIVQQDSESGVLLVYIYKPYMGECHITQMVKSNSLKFEITWPGTTFAQLQAFEATVPTWKLVNNKSPSCFRNQIFLPVKESRFFFPHHMSFVMLNSWKTLILLWVCMCQKLVWNIVCVNIVIKLSYVL